MKVMQVLKEYSEDVDVEIGESLKTIDPSSLCEASAHLTKAGGKKMRPALVILSCEAVGGRKEDAFKTASAVELIHTFSLIHDDIMDKDDMRRGKPSVHAIWGEPMAILAGDTIFSKAFGSMLETNTENVQPQRIMRAMSSAVDACIKLCEGQALDIGFEGKLDVNEDEYLNMIYKKTAALISAATKAGALIGGGTDEQIDALAEYGRLIGMAFQIQDDYLDVVSDAAEIGKPVGSDIVKGKMTLMVVHTLSKASDEDKERLIYILNQNDENLVDDAIALFEKYDAVEYTRNIALEDVKTAKELLNVLDDSDAKKALELFADFVIERTH